jgi:hypothetical protein
MRVSLIETDTGSILADGSSIDDNEGSVKLDYAQLKDNKSYAIRYEFFDK